MCNPKEINCIAYCRVSTEKQVKSGLTEEESKLEDFSGHSIREQKESISKFCKYKSNDRIKFIVNEYFIDPGVSAKKIPFFERPSGRKIKEYLTNNQNVKYLLLKSLDRAFRDTEDGLHTCRLLKDTFNVDLYVVDGNGDPINTGTAIGKFILTQLLSVDDFQVSKNNERTSQVLRSKQRNGKILGKNLIGMKRNKEGNQYILDFEKFKEIEHYYNMRREGKTFRQIESISGKPEATIRRYISKYNTLKDMAYNEK